MKFIQQILLITMLVTVAACKHKAEQDETVTPAQILYDKANASLAAGYYERAAEEYEKIFFQHPGNSLTPLAELMQAYSLYLDGEYEEAVDVLEIFIQLHPRHTHIQYAYYLKAMAHYVQISGVKLDQSSTRYAKESMQEIINRFPGSKYALDANLKLDLINAHLAGKEMEVGRYYLAKRNLIGAIHRFQAVINEYKATEHVMEALYRLVECNVMMGLNDEARKYQEVLLYNYPDSKWAKYSKTILK